MNRNLIWSSKVQSIKQLDNSREQKFREDRKDLYLKLLGLAPGMVVADIGCGPGTLTRKLSRWLGPSSKIIGVDRDSSFIEYAKERAEKESLHSYITYINGDGLDLPLDDNSVDAITSHTVIEHVPNEAFLLEQKRVCKKGGRVSVQTVRPESKLTSSTFSSYEVTDRENILWDIIEPAYKESNKKYLIGNYAPSLTSLPELFEKLGFINIQVDAIYFPFVIDDDRNTLEEKKALLNIKRVEEMEAAIQGFNMLEGKMPKEELDELLSLIDDRHNGRLNLLLSGKKLWDYEINPVWIVSGEVK